jgi:HTH-type transcriptional regulator/antitoxin HipB
MRKNDQATARSAKQLGLALKSLRKQQEKTQKQVAVDSGLRQAGVSLLEGGATGVRIDSLFKVLTALDLEIVIRSRKKQRLAVK